MNTEASFVQFPLIETKRFILREINQQNSQDLLRFFSDEDVMRYYDIKPLKSVEESANLINRFSERFNANAGIRWGISRKEDAAIIGTCGYHNWIKRSYKAEIGYELSKEFWRQGVMSEVLQAVITLGFREMGLNRIEALVNPQNVASRELLLKLGFQEEGVLREYACHKGKFTDLIMFAALRRNCE